jgi:FkbM family methyltransferase
VHGFEPNPATYRRLSDNIALNGYSQVTAHSLALSDQGGSATLYLPKDDNLGEASLQKYDGETESTVITTLTADEWMESADLGNPARIDLIKIDVQGYETRAIRGASKLLARYRPLVICEFEERWLRMAGSSCEELKQLFNSLGYTANKLVAGKLVPVAAAEVHGFENLILVPRNA